MQACIIICIYRKIYDVVCWVVVAASTTWTMIAYEPHITRWRPSEQEREERDKGKDIRLDGRRRRCLWIYARASEKQTTYARFVCCIWRKWENERGIESKRVRKNVVFFSLFSLRSFAYFSIHTHIRM
jgi:hypothetical protein